MISKRPYKKHIGFNRFSNKVNIMSLAYTKNIKLYIKLINVRVQRINKLYLNIFKIVIVSFLFLDKLEKV